MLLDPRVVWNSIRERGGQGGYVNKGDELVGELGC